MEDVTLILKVQVPPVDAMAPPVSLTPASPPVALNALADVPFHELSVPPHGEAGLSAGGLAVTKPGGKRSSKVTPVIAAAVLLVIVNVSVAVPFRGMVATEKDLLMVGFGEKVIVAAAVPPLPPLLDETVLVILL